MLILIFLLLSSISLIYSLPVVLMHGILSNVENMNEMKNYLESEFKLDVIVPEIGNGKANSFNIKLSKQGDMLCDMLNSNILLENGFNYVGISQGGILGRYYVEKCGNYQVNNLITLVSPHGGVYYDNIPINMYNNFSQYFYSFSSYWRNPFKYEEYIDITLLADLNNEKSTLYDNKHKLSKLKNFIMVYSPYDNILNPPDSGKFSTFKVNSLEVIPIEKTIMYETLGLDIFMKENRLHIYTSNCSHDEQKEYMCFIQLHDLFKAFL